MIGFQSILTKFAVGLASMAALASADNPVHCVKSQVLGTWEFTVNEELISDSLFEIDEICTHEQPNRVQVIPKDHQFNLVSSKPLRKVRITLDLDNTAHEIDQHGHRTGRSGTWTMIYDQSFTVLLHKGAEKERFIANFKHTIKDQVPRNSWSTRTSSDYNSFDSICSETMVGFWQQSKNNSEPKFQCAVGKQIELNNLIQPDAAKSDEKLAFYKPVQLAQVDGMSQNRTQNGNTGVFEIAEEFRTILAEQINKLDLGWSATSYAENDLAQAKEPTFAQVSSTAFGEQTESFADALEKAQRYLRHPEKIRKEELPTDFRWDDFEGYDFVGKQADQGGCGSCYAVAANTMLESRIKLWYGEDHELSAHFPLQCNFMNEGCHGGWGIFNGFFLESFYTVSAADAPYKASTGYGQCHQYAGLKKKAKSAKTYYVGNGYEDMSEEDMLWELRSYGPFLLDFNAGQAFQMYRSGVLSEKGYPKAIDLLNAGTKEEVMEAAADLNASNEKTASDYGLMYEYLTHSTLVIGYGREPNGEKYWVVRNSYGPRWGEKGNFRLRRGFNDFSAESENSAIEPVLFGENEKPRSHGFRV